MFPTKFQICWPFGSEKDTKKKKKKKRKDFQDGSHGGHLWFPIGTILSTFDVQVTPMLPT